MLFFAGVKVEVEGLERLARRRTVRVLCESSELHRYAGDPQLAFRCSSGSWQRKNCFKIPWLLSGWHFKTAGHVPVPRDDPRACGAER